MKLFIDIGYIVLASLLLGMIFLSFNYSFGEAFFLGILFMPGAFALKYFMPQLARSSGKKKIADVFYLSMAIIIFTFFLMMLSHFYVISPMKFQQIWVNPVFMALIIGVIAAGEWITQKLCARFFSKVPDTVSFFSDRRKVSLQVQDILYVESNDREVFIHSCNGTLYRNKTPISQWESILGKDFVRTHRAFLVNAEYISEVGNESVNVSDEKIPVSRKYKDEVMRKIKR